MRLCTLIINNQEYAALIIQDRCILIDTINKAYDLHWANDIFTLLQLEQLNALEDWVAEALQLKLFDSLTSIPVAEVQYAPLYRHPRKIWGIGMNYVTDPTELDQVSIDEEPVSFMKPDTTLIGTGATIQIPPDVGVITAEAELAIIIGKTCHHISEAEAHHYVAGITTTLDMTAFDIHARNQRFLTRAKSFDTFFSFGPELITLNDIPDILALTVETHHNEACAHHNMIFNMRYRPWFTVAFHSKVMTLLPGDIIMTGTPGAVVIRDGDIVGCRIHGLEKDITMLSNPVSV